MAVVEVIAVGPSGAVLQRAQDTEVASLLRLNKHCGGFLNSPAEPGACILIFAVGRSCFMANGEPWSSVCIGRSQAHDGRSSVSGKTCSQEHERSQLPGLLQPISAANLLIGTTHNSMVLAVSPESAMSQRGLEPGADSDKLLQER